MKQLGRAVGLASELGIAMGVGAAGFVLVSLFLGRWLDARLDTFPVATISLALCGAVAGQVSLVRMATRAMSSLTTHNEGASIPGQAVGALGTGFRVLLLTVIPAVAGLALGVWIDGLAGTGMRLTAALSCIAPIAGLVIAVRAIRASRPAEPAEDGETCSDTGD